MVDYAKSKTGLPHVREWDYLDLTKWVIWIRLASEWVSFAVTSMAPVKQNSNSRTKSHMAAESILQIASQKTIIQSVVNAQAEQIETTARTAYKETKRKRHAHGFEQEIDWQELNGINMGRILHFNVVCASFQEYISSEMRCKFLKILCRVPP